MALKRPIPAPAWIAYPNIQRGSIGWRMGYAEDYSYKLHDWLDKLSPEDEAEYIKLFPEPNSWSGYWKGGSYVELAPGCPHDTEAFYLWRENGEPEYNYNRLCQEYRAGKIHKKDFLLFWGHQSSPDGAITASSLSQWWSSEFKESIETYHCAEQYMMASKARLFGDTEILSKIMKSYDPKTIKALGRKVKNFDETIWNRVKYGVVLNGSYLKFSQNKPIRDFLLSTKAKILVEASPYDAVWGIKMSVSDENAYNPLKWKGENLLGFALMEARDELRRVFFNEDLVDFSFRE